MSINVAAAMAAIGTALDGITTLNVFAYIPDSVTPPAAAVGYPDELTYDNTMQRGTDRATFPITVVVGIVHDESTVAAASAYMAGDGTVTTSVKAAVDAIGPGVRVTRALTMPLVYSGVEFLGVQFEVDYVA